MNNERILRRRRKLFKKYPVNLKISSAKGFKKFGTQDFGGGGASAPVAPPPGYAPDVPNNIAPLLCQDESWGVWAAAHLDLVTSLVLRGGVSCTCSTVIQ